MAVRIAPSGALRSAGCGRPVRPAWCVRQAKRSMAALPSEPADPGRWRVEARRLDAHPDTEALFARVFAARPDPFWLDTAAPGTGHRFSYLGAGDGPHTELLTADSAAGTVTVASPGGTATRTGGLLDTLAERLARWRRRLGPRGADGAAGPRTPGAGRAPVRPPLHPGYVGYLGYGLAPECGVPLRHTGPPPDGALLFADRVVAVDHLRRETWLLALGTPDDADATARHLDDTAAEVAACPPAPAASPATPPPWRPPAPFPLALELRNPPAAYRALVEACRGAIGAGDSYELCLTTTLTAPGPFDPHAVYHHLRRISPTPYAAFLGLGGRAVLCSSPERFLRVDPDGRVETRPIKGTRPRSPDRAADERLAAELAASAKDRAENLMIVDLARSDLSRVCAPASVRTTERFGIETFATVHQMVSTVTGRLAPGRGAVDAVRATFPPASMTGAPKERSVGILDGLEGAARGVYSGALGWFSVDGGADLAVTIRSVVVEADRATVGVGGAVVWDSDSDAEWAEALVKAVPGIGALVLAGRGTAGR